MKNHEDVQYQECLDRNGSGFPRQASVRPMVRTLCRAAGLSLVDAMVRERMPRRCRPPASQAGHVLLNRPGIAVGCSICVTPLMREKVVTDPATIAQALAPWVAEL